MVAIKLLGLSNSCISFCEAELLSCFSNSKSVGAKEKNETSAAAIIAEQTNSSPIMDSSIKDCGPKP